MQKQLSRSTANDPEEFLMAKEVDDLTGYYLKQKWRGWKFRHKL